MSHVTVRIYVTDGDGCENWRDLSLQWRSPGDRNLIMPIVNHLFDEALRAGIVIEAAPYHWLGRDAEAKHV